MMRSDSFELNTEQENYLSQYMNRVSRSFALVVNGVEEPLKHYLSTAYLVCRVADNIEDCDRSSNWKQTRFDEFISLLEHPNRADDILANWSGKLWPNLSSSEEKMMSLPDGVLLWDIYQQIPYKTRQSINRWTSVMAQGMSEISDPKSSIWSSHHDGVRVLGNVESYDQYCFYVAGTVGYMATEMAISHYGLNEDESESLLKYCEACGRGLQKTNIIKDFRHDLSRGVSYIPAVWLREIDSSPLLLNGAPAWWKCQVIQNAVSDLRDATNYVVALPSHATGYRMAGLLCLVPAMETLLLAARKEVKLFTSAHEVKISRGTMVRCIRKARSLAKDDDAIIRYTRDVIRTLDALCLAFA